MLCFLADSHRVLGAIRCLSSLEGHFPPSIFTWAVLSDEQMSNGKPFSLLNDEQMSSWLGVEHQSVTLLLMATRNPATVTTWDGTKTHGKYWDVFSQPQLVSLPDF